MKQILGMLWCRKIAELVKKQTLMAIITVVESWKGEFCPQQTQDPST